MTNAIIVLAAVIAVTVIGIVFSLLGGLPKESLDEQAERIRRNAEEKAKKKRIQEEKRRRKKA